MKNSLSKKQKKTLIRILVALAMFAAVFITDKIIVLGNVFEGPAAWVFPFCLYLVVYLLIGYDVLWRAIRNIAHGQIFDENFLMCVATLGAFALAIYRGAIPPSRKFLNLSKTLRNRNPKQKTSSLNSRNITPRSSSSLPFSWP